MDCAACSEDLRDSQYQQSGKSSASQRWKSCPHCSERDGVHVFYPYEDFGFRDMGDAVRVQSWCGSCRGNQTSLSPSFTC